MISQKICHLTVSRPFSGVFLKRYFGVNHNFNWFSSVCFPSAIVHEISCNYEWVCEYHNLYISDYSLFLKVSPCVFLFLFQTNRLIVLDNLIEEKRTDLIEVIKIIIKIWFYTLACTRTATSEHSTNVNVIIKRKRSIILQPLKQQTWIINDKNNDSMTKVKKVQKSQHFSIWDNLFKVTYTGDQFPGGVLHNSSSGTFLWILSNFLWQLFYKTPQGDYFWELQARWIFKACMESF